MDLHVDPNILKLLPLRIAVERGLGLCSSGKSLVHVTGKTVRNMMALRRYCETKWLNIKLEFDFS
ncbi:hypothetical protein H5410_019813 [Solanum commersonii]|uniref:Uncharacterized protein n=1 Tax=Solanum commersonii TaxID=4109 RepID=A0A9J5ZAN6_SOLCO|nr:hypothetical protein H5410_019813 [Solanum commersonii]